MNSYIGPVAVWGAIVLILSGSVKTTAGTKDAIRTAGEMGSAKGEHDYAGSACEGAPIDYEIFYGLNDSHSHSWVQQNNQGVVGVTYFLRFEGGAPEGSLIYRTIDPDGTVSTEVVTTGSRMERSVLLYDADSRPHIFVARSDNADQVIVHYYKGDTDLWQSETIYHFYNWGGKFIYEMSADLGPDSSFHLLVLKSRSDIDSDDYWNAWMDSYLFHMSNTNGFWQVELIHQYDMAYTYDHYIKCSCRQNLEIDDEGFVHVTFSQQIRATDDPSRLLYATNKSGAWQIETALSNDFGARDDAGWFPSLCLDSDGTPYVSCMYVNRVYTYSAVYCRLLLLERLGDGVWQSQVVAAYDDGYYGRDGRCFTGALSHLVFDGDNVPHIIFSDIASSHWNPYQRLNVGNIRYAVYRGGAWDIETIYRQPLPNGFMDATEMFGECLVVSDLTDTIRVIGQELEVSGSGSYSLRLVEFGWANPVTSIEDNPAVNLPEQFSLSQNFPNPFNPVTVISYSLPSAADVRLDIYNVVGQKVASPASGRKKAGTYSVTWDATEFASGVYFYRLTAGDYTETKRMLLLK